MKFIQIIFLLASVLWQLPSHAAAWVYIGGNDEVSIFIDTESIRKTGNRVKSWLKWNWTKAQDIPGSYPTKTYLAEKQLQVSDCHDRTLAVMQGVRYMALDGGAVIDSYMVEEKNWKFSEVVPETIGETIINFACYKAYLPRK